MAAKDPDIHIAHWMRHGAPIGVAVPIPACGIFPRVTRIAEANCELRKWMSKEVPGPNYKSMRENQHLVEPELRRVVDAKYATWYDSWDEVLRQWGDVLVSRLAAIIKEKADGSLKVRIIIDMLRSHLNEFVKLEERIVLPRLRDMLEGVMWQVLHLQPGEEVEQLVTDFCDAFHTLRVLPEERRHQLARANARSFVGYDTVVFGGGGSPLVWGRVGAFLGRSGQAMLSPLELCVQIHVDDPHLSLKGTLMERERNATVLFL